LLISRFDAVPVERFVGLVTSRPLDEALGLRSSMRQAVRRRLLLGFVPLGPFARTAKIDKVAHAKPGGD